MQLKSLRGKGFVAFPSLFELDLERVNGQIVAVCGPNGAGKSTLLGLYAGALYRSLPKAALKDIAIGRGAFIEARFVNGKEYVVRQRIDAFSGKSETSLTDAEGKVILTSGKVKEYDEWAKTHLPPPEVFYASLFSAQKSEGLIGMKKGERKAVILRNLGLERLEQLAQIARKHKNDTDIEIAQVRARMNELGRYDLEHLQGVVNDWQNALSVEAVTLRETETNLSAARLNAEAIQKQRRDYDTLVEKRTVLLAHKDKLERELEDLNTRIANNEAVVKERAEIEAAVARNAELAQKISELKQEESELRVKVSDLEGQRTALYGRERDAQARRSSLERAIKGFDATLESKDLILEAVRKLSDLEAQKVVVEAGLRAADEELEKLRGQTLTDKDGRISDLRGGLEEVRDFCETIGTAKKTADQFLKKDERVDAESKAMPTQLQEANERYSAIWSELQEVSQEMAKAQRLAARQSEIESAEKAKREAVDDLSLVATDIADILHERERVQTSYAEVIELAESKRQLVSVVLEEQEALKPQLAKVERLAQADTLIKERSEQKVKVRVELDSITIPDLPEAPPAPIDVSTYDRAVNGSRRLVQDYQSKLAVAERDLKDAEEKEARRQTLLVEQTKLEQELADWTRLAADLGRNGVQSLEIDAAGPEMTALANDLLRRSGDTQFSISVETTAMSADGKRELEDCLIMVSDSKTGKTRDAEEFSGGEAVFLNEAVMGAFVQMLQRRGKITGTPLLIRDESGASLDGERAHQWIAMLRIMKDILGGATILYVSHNSDLWAMADSRIEILPSGDLNFT